MEMIFGQCVPKIPLYGLTNLVLDSLKVMLKQLGDHLLCSVLLGYLHSLSKFLIFDVKLIKIEKQK